MARSMSLSREVTDFHNESLEPRHLRHQKISSASSLSSEEKENFETEAISRKMQYDWGKPLTSHSWAYGWNDRFGVKTTFVSKRNTWAARVMLKAQLNFFGRRIIHTEFKMHHFTRSWMSMPSISSLVTILNIRPNDTPIFEACREHDLPTIQHLLETGKASVFDVNEDRDGLLEVSYKKTIVLAFGSTLADLECITCLATLVNLEI